MTDQVIGRGRVYLALGEGGSRALGNVTDARVAVEVSNVAHYSSEDRFRTKDASASSQISRTLTFVVDSITEENLLLFLGGRGGSSGQTEAAGVSRTFPTLTGGRWYDLGARQVSSVSAAPAVQGTDFLVDWTNGRVYIIEGGVLDGAENVVVSFNVAALTLRRLESGGATIQQGRLEILTDNAVGENHIWTFPHVAIRGGGDMTLVGDSWVNVTFTADVLQPDAAVAALYRDSLPTTPIDAAPRYLATEDGGLLLLESGERLLLS